MNETGGAKEGGTFVKGEIKGILWEGLKVPCRMTRGEVEKENIG